MFLFCTGHHVDKFPRFASSSVNYTRGISFDWAKTWEAKYYFLIARRLNGARLQELYIKYQARRLPSFFCVTPSYMGSTNSLKCVLFHCQNYFNIRCRSCENGEAGTFFESPVFYTRNYNRV